MSRKKRIYIAASVGVLIAIGVVFCPPLTREGRLRAFLHEGAQAFREGNMEFFDDHIDDGYVGVVGADKEEALAIARAFVGNTRRRRVKLEEIEVTIDDGRAKAQCAFRLRAMVVMPQDGRVVPLRLLMGRGRGAVDTAEVELVLRDGEWRVTRLDIDSLSKLLEGFAQLSQ